jgi:hypothetical protein
VHFKDVRDKPIDIIHHLKLDRTYTGLQTLGAETVVDVWLHNKTPAIAVSQTVVEEEAKPLEDTPEGWVIPHLGKSDLLSEPFLSSMQDPIEEEEEEEDTEVDRGEKDKTVLPKTEVKEEVMETEEEPVAAAAAEVDRQTTYIRCTDKAGDPYYLPVTILPNNHQRQVGLLAGQPVGQPLRKPPLATRAPRNKINSGIRLLKTVEPKMEIIDMQQTSAADGMSMLKRATSAAPLLVKREMELPSLGENASVLKRQQLFDAAANGDVSFKKHSVLQLQKQRSVPCSPDRPSAAAAKSCSLTSSPVQPVASATNSSTSLLRTRSLQLPPGTSLLKRNVAANSVAAAAVPHLQQHVPQVTELEKAAPDVALSFWSRLLGRNPEDTQAEIETRVAKRGLGGVKKQADHFAFFGCDAA